MNKSVTRTGALLLLVLAVPSHHVLAGSQKHPTRKRSTSDSESGVYDFSITRAYLEWLESNHTIQPTSAMQLGHHSGLHQLSDDCEMHIVGMPQGDTPGSPTAVIIEPPNLCKLDPEGKETSGTDQWAQIFDGLNGKTCQVTGFPRIFTEHAKSGGGASNPNHVFELHPALSIDCVSPKFSFANFLRVYPGMRAITPSTTASCISQRQLEVRYDPDLQHYVFRESGGRCGNFAIVEVQTVYTSSIHDVGGGHSAIARVSPDGQSIVTLKVYTLSPSDADDWLAKVKTPDVGGRRMFIHGLFTYDYFAIQKIIHPKGQPWQTVTLSQWTLIKFPLAFVIFGEAETAPWEE